MTDVSCFRRHRFLLSSELASPFQAVSEVLCSRGCLMRFCKMRVRPLMAEGLMSDAKISRGKMYLSFDFRFLIDLEPA